MQCVRFTRMFRYKRDLLISAKRPSFDKQDKKKKKPCYEVYFYIPMDDRVKTKKRLEAQTSIVYQSTIRITILKRNDSGLLKPKRCSLDFLSQYIHPIGLLPFPFFLHKYIYIYIYI